MMAATILLASGLLHAQNYVVPICGSAPGLGLGPMYSAAAANAASREAVIYPASQLSGISGQIITAAYFNADLNGGMLGTPNFKMYLKEVAAADWGAGSLDWATAIIGATLVYDNNPAPNVGSGSGWKKFPFSTHFTYGGTQNLAVFMEYVNPVTSRDVYWYFEGTEDCIDKNNNNTTKYINTSNGIPGSSLSRSDYRRPVIAFDISITCQPATAVAVPVATRTPTSAVVNWTGSASAPANGYEYYYNTSNASPVNATVPSGTTAAGVTSATLSGLAPSVTHYVWVRAVCSDADKSPWTSTVKFLTAPVNDESSGAITLTVNGDYNCGVTANGTTLSATQSAETAPACSSTGINDDVWFKFTATAASHRISFTNVSAGIMVAAVYSGTPGSLVPVAGACGSNTIYITGLNIGQTYYVRAYTSVATAATLANFTICLGTPPPPPANDECVNAITLMVNPDFNCSFVNAGTTKDATGGVFTCDLGLAGNDVWYKFVATNSIHWVSLLNVTGSTNGMGFQVLDGCGGTMLVCANGQASIANLVPGNTYYVRVATYDYLSNPVITFNVCVRTVPPNDNCAGAIMVAVNPGSACTSVVAGSVSGATASTPGASTTSCGTFDDDVWFKFVALETNHIVTLQNRAGSSTDLSFQVFSACGAATALICANPFAPALVTGLTPGNTYYLRVASYISASGQTSSFDVCISTAPAMAYSSSTTTQSSTANTAAGASNQQIIRAEIVVSGASAPISAIQLNFNLAATTNPADIAAARVYFTGTSATFSTTNAFGNAITNPTVNFSINGSQVLAGGLANTTNYFWLVYDIAPGATPGNIADGAFASVIAGGNSFVPVVTNPAGTRTIVAAIGNDEATGATALTVGGGCTGNPYDNTLASQSSNEPFPACTGTAGYAGMWYKFTAPSSGAVKISNDGTGTLGNSRIALFSASDSSDYSTFTILACDDDNGVTGATRSLLYATGLTPNVTYWVLTDLNAQAGIRGTYCITVDELAASMLSANAGNCTAGQALVAGFNTGYAGWISLVDNSGNLNAMVRQQAGNATGYNSSRTITTGASRVDGSGTPYLNRNFLINSTGTASTGEIMLFFTNTELTAVGAPLSSLSITRVPGTTCTPNYTGGASALLQQTGNGSANGVSWIRATTPGFSNFYIHSGNAPLPITLVYFNGAKTFAGNQLNWKVNCTSVSISFEIERSSNGRNYTSIGSFGASQARCLTPFDFADSKPLAGVNYYRIKIIDLDGEVSYTNVVAINNKVSGIEIIGMQPTLVQSEAVLYIAAAKAGKLQIAVTDMTGRQLETRTISVLEGENKVRLNFGTLAAGVYNLSSFNESGKTTIRFVKE